MSYASQDAAAAHRICQALRAAGVEVWFDQNELVGGDAWDAKIRKQIAECALFVPVISAATQARLEGYFRLEWKLAAQRTLAMADEKAFVLPVVIDGTRDGAAKVPAEFKAVQWTRLPGGETPPAFRARVQALLGDPVEAGVPPIPSEGHLNARPATKTVRRRTPFASWGTIGVISVAAVAVWQPWNRPAPGSVGTPDSQAAETKPGTPVSESQRLVTQAQRIFEDGDEMSRENYFLAEDLVKRAVALDPAEPSAWALFARLSYAMIWHNIDASDVRRDAMRRQAERAHALAPGSLEVQIAFADARMMLRQDVPGVERDLIALAAREPGNWRVQRSLGTAYRQLGRWDDAIGALQRALVLSNELPISSADLVNALLRSGRHAEAEAVVARALARRPSGRLRTFDLMLRTQWEGDLAAGGIALESWPDWLLLEDRGAFLAWRTWFWSRQPAKALAAAQRLQRDYLRDSFFTGPRAVLTARSHESAGHVEAARADWRTTVLLCDRELASTPESVPALYWKAWALARLGDSAGALVICTQMQQRNQLIRTTFYGGPGLSPLWATVGRTDLAFDELRRRPAVSDQFAITRAMLAFEPAFEPLRSDPRFRELVATAPAPEKETAVAAPMLDQKSVAVLAFTTLSDDKANEYFSDGISEELIGVLGRVPGLAVTARTSAFHFKGTNTPVPEIARQLGVAHVVEGSVRKQGDRVRITVQLVKAADGFQVWSQTFMRELKDIFAVQEEIAGLIAQNLQVKLGAAPTAAGPVDPEVFRLYLEGRQEWGRRNEEGYAKAQALFERALVLDPKFARAHSGLADVWMMRGLPEDRELATQEDARIRSLVDRALALDPSLAEAYATLGRLHHRVYFRYDEAEENFKKALALNPNYATARQWYGRYLFDRARIDAALSELEVAARLDPMSAVILANQVVYRRSARRWEGSSAELERYLAEFDRYQALRPDSAWPRVFRAEVLLRLGRQAEARDLVRAVVGRIDGGRPESNSVNLAVLLARLGEGATAARLGLALLADPETTPRTALAVRLVTGPREQALVEWEKADLSRARHGVFYLADYFDDVRDDPRFQRKLEQSGLLADYRAAWAQYEAWRKQRGPIP